ncbi:MAG: MFS transporter, partial [Sulfobacillus thermotolerans]|nr:MFS transporter [Sulfobacillus thermotolerans]
LSTGGMGPAITLYEAALGLGIASGPLLGGALGSLNWRDPFFGTASLMAIAFLATWTLVKEPPAKEVPRTARDIFRALGDRAILTNALIGLSYSYAFFTILAYSPLTLGRLKAITLGYTYFFWGILVAFSSVVVVNWLLRRMKPVTILSLNLPFIVILFVLAGILPGYALLYIVVITGFFCGIANALFTTLAMEISPYSRSISSGAYNFLRWAGAAVAPILSGLIGQHFGMTVPFFVSAGILCIGIIALLSQGHVLTTALERHSTMGEVASQG